MTRVNIFGESYLATKPTVKTLKYLQDGGAGQDHFARVVSAMIRSGGLKPTSKTAS
jgi:hypothetical protein